MTSIKKQILQNQNLLNLIGQISQIWFVVNFRKRIKGKSNKTNILKNVIFRGGEI